MLSRTLWSVGCAAVVCAVWVAGPAYGGQGDYPCWRGPDGSGASQSGTKVIEDLSKAKLLWDSEYIPGVYGSAIMTGQGGPIAAEGKVLLTYHVPHDDVCAEKPLEDLMQGRYNASFARGAWALDPQWAQVLKDPKDVKLKEEFGRRKYGVSADDVIHCLDAETGKTLWKAVFEKKGLNWMNSGVTSNKCGPHLVPCVADGKVYALGNTARLYCVDAATGKLVWETGLGPKHKALEAAKEKARQEKSQSAFFGGRMVDRMSLCAPLNVVDGVVVAYDDAGKVLGFETSTGKKLWEAKTNGGLFTAAPVRWVCGDRTYVISGGTCVDPKDGKVLWTVPPGKSGSEVPACVSGNLLIWGSAAYEITPQGATKRWDYPVRLEDGSKFVTRERLSFRSGTPVALDGYACFKFMSDGQGVLGSEVALVDLATGKAAARITSTSENNYAFAQGNGSWVGGDGRAFLELGRDGGSQIAMFHMKPEGFASKVSILKVPHYAMSSTCCYARGRLFLRMQNRVACWDLRAP